MFAHDNNNHKNKQIELLKEKNNDYINVVLMKYIKDTLPEINRICLKLDLVPEMIIKITNYFYAKLAKIDFITAYLERKFTRISKNSLEIDYQSFLQFIHHSIPVLKETKLFVALAETAEDEKTFDQDEKIKNKVIPTQHLRFYKKPIAQLKVDEKVSIAQMQTELEQKNNEYINKVLSPYIKKTLAAIDRAAIQIGLDKGTIRALQHKCVSKIAEINFLDAYVNKHFLDKKAQSWEIDEGRFAKFIHSKIPQLSSPEEFIEETLGLAQKKQVIFNEINRAKKIINQYAGTNKKAFIQEFNREVKKLSDSFDQQNYFSINQIAKTSLLDILDKLQTNETSYYTKLTFFAETRKSHSSLQPKINEARKIIQAMDGVKKSPATKTSGFLVLF